jgi:F0F1-type ATP synthase assembly protein I
MKDLFSPKFLKIIAIWSLIPSYLVAGGGIGYGVDRWLKTFPYFTGAGLLLGFSLAVRDMLRLKKEWH